MIQASNKTSYKLYSWKIFDSTVNIFSCPQSCLVVYLTTLKLFIHGVSCCKLEMIFLNLTGYKNDKLAFLG